ncbi:alkanesulfonate monooxygenase SsuD/methylene tetrahydromethanopterin reductase-like flavin-dependent oxidoreductase (luciferase family) [Microbacterium sp. AG1240]|uniref:LLM class flavin-dependent oxidoreductase n=1 Tax=Microbacterium sp. AG1240 TaxID=2183992 RepID=UPI000EAB7076|nr:LLM class flavin-dependent oxidoreductase [Microbacterium sp. AG1240]RKT31471.1 alkanesulfonate monooxygenase SsuD/methylene tetrahydromethanopterin reductase-like flavin-dependent oxidoreductase (luciferase family) [Microbacterium sp. AG1240]
MKVGLFLTNEHSTPADMGAHLGDQLALARTAADAGWHSIFTGQHFVTEGTQRLQPLPFLARLSGEVPGMRLGTGIHLWTLGNPVAMAEEFATLDVLTGGRMIAGLGLGYRAEEFAAFGVDRASRARRFERNLEIARALWSGEPVTVDEPWCSLDGATIGTPPVQRPLPVWIGGTSNAAIRRAGRLSDGWILNPAAPAGTIAEQASLYRSTSQDSGRGDGWIAAFREVYCAPTTERARELALPFLEKKYGRYEAWGQQDGHPDGQALTGGADEVGAGRFIVGDPEHCRRELARFRDLVGVDEFLLRTDWPDMPAAAAMSSLELLTREVVPGL